MDEVLEAFSFQERPKKKSGTRGCVELSMGSFDTGENHDAEQPQPDTTCTHNFVPQRPFILVEERTFLTWKPQLRDAKSVD